MAKEIEGDTSGNFCKVLKNLLYSPVEYDCRELRRAIKGAGTDEEALIEILASRSRKRIQEINNLYPQCKDLKFSIRYNISFPNSIQSTVGKRRGW